LHLAAIRANRIFYRSKSDFLIVLSLRQLRYFDALARSRHFGRAAELVNVSQPALSMQIKEMERELGTPLFERRRNDVQLTPVGIETHRRAVDILNGARDLVDFARHGTATLTGPLSLGIIPSIAPYLLPNALPILRERFPALQLRFRETQTKTLLEELLAGELDVILLSLPLGHSEIDTLGLFEDRFLYVTQTPRMTAADKRISLSSIDESRLLLLEEGHCLRDQALQFCSTARSAVANGKPDLGAASLSTIMQLIANGFGTTLLPEMALQAEIGENRAVCAVRFSDPEPSREIGLAWRRRSPRQHDFLALGDTLKSCAPSRRL
jgi:LysR family hydrogen peroxide-inducible transcriptional activator